MQNDLAFFLTRHSAGQTALLVHIEFTTLAVDANLLGASEAVQAEWRELVRAAEVEIIGEEMVRRDKPDPHTFLGSGKAEQIKQHIVVHPVERVLINAALSPTQERNLENIFGCRVMDRTGLILEIFAKRARTFEGKLQVELAQLRYLKTRLVGTWTHLERQRGGIGLRSGAGETQLEVDRRIVATRIKYVQERLEKVTQQRALQRRTRRRQKRPVVALVGYTNAGKSTLFNRLTEAEVYVADQLFATLDPTVRPVQLPGAGTVMLADTVGFIRNLPHDLVAAFRATLEEVCYADLLLHVIDVTSEERAVLQAAVQDVLTEIEANHVPILEVYNKIDCVPHLSPRIDCNDMGKPIRVWCSAQTGQGIAELHRAIAACCGVEMHEQLLLLLPSQGDARAALYAENAVVSETIDDMGAFHLKIKMPRWRWDLWCHRFLPTE